MGAVRFGAPEDFVLWLARTFGSTRFVETGTHEGESARWAARHFHTVDTIERAPHYFDEARRRSARCANIRFHLGDSPAVLRELAPSVPRWTIFWLDAHWSGGHTAGVDVECPLLKELEALDAVRDPLILIDDARLFLGPPPLPHRAEQWPDLMELAALLGRRVPVPYVAVVEDVIGVFPSACRSQVVDHLRAARNPSPPTSWAGRLLARLGRR